MKFIVLFSLSILFSNLADANGYSCPVFSVALQLLERCWSPDVFIDSLVYRFWKLSLQVFEPQKKKKKKKKSQKFSKKKLDVDDTFFLFSFYLFERSCWQG